MKVQLIHNPVAGPRSVDQDLVAVIGYLRSQDWEVVLRRTHGPGDATTYAREAVADGYDIAVAVGGDGTLGEVVSGLVGSDCVLGVLPVGTGNVWAHMVGLPVWSPMNRAALRGAAEILVEGHARQIDLGRAGDRYFALWVGVGFDAQVARDVEPYREMRRSLGNLTYLVLALARTLEMRGTRVTVTIDGRVLRQRALLILVSNAQLYGPSLRLDPHAQLDDGLLDVYIFSGVGTLDYFRHYGLMLLRKHMDYPELEVYRARHVEIHGDKPLPLHIDGDPCGYTPTTITVVPKAARVVMPTWASSSLFEDGKGQQDQPNLAQRIAQRFRHERELLLEEGERLRNDLGRRLGLPPQSR